MNKRYLLAGLLRLDLQDERAWYGTEPLKLSGKAFALLRLLMRSPELLVTKEAIFDNVWGGLAVSDSVLTTAAKELRQALDDDARSPVWIETVHRRGYRFMQLTVEADEVQAEVIPQPLPPISETPPRQPRWPVTAMAVLIGALLLAGAWYYFAQGRPALAATPKSVAVLPFRDLSSSAENRWFADGLTEEVQARLARTPDIQVVSQLSVGSSGSGLVAERARNLGVAHILSGSVRHGAGRVRVTVELVHASDGRQLWTQTYDHAAKDVIPIQEDIAYRIAIALKTVMEPSRLRAMVAAGTRSVDAYQAYLIGVAESQRSLATGGREHVLAAAAAYERARTIDPDFAEAHWRAAQNWFGKSTRINGSIFGETLNNAERQAEYLKRVDRAIASSANDVDRLKYLSAKAVLQMELRKAHRLMVAYLQARPRDIDAWEDMAELASFANEHEWLVRAGERIHTLSLQAHEPRSRAITVTTMAMQLPDAVARARQQMQLRPKSIMTRYQAHRALIWAGKAEEARLSLDDIVGSDLPQENKLLAQLRQACAERQIEQALDFRQQLETLPGLSLSGRWQTAEIIGDHEGAVKLLARLDNREDMLELMEFMLNPSFESGRYPLLSNAMARDGVVRWKVWPMPGACRVK
jgi:TolB-like protein/DNA-binding winged helix-turn-helix (wHTH) protein